MFGAHLQTIYLSAAISVCPIHASSVAAGRQCRTHVPQGSQPMFPVGKLACILNSRGQCFFHYDIHELKLVLNSPDSIALGKSVATRLNPIHIHTKSVCPFLPYTTSPGILQVVGDCNGGEQGGRAMALTERQNSDVLVTMNSICCMTANSDSPSTHPFHATWTQLM